MGQATPRTNVPGDPGNYRQYVASQCATFLKTSERFGGLSNMAGGYPLKVGIVEISSSEAFYQAMRFPHLPDFQEEIINTKNALLSKRLAYTRIRETREDWRQVNLPLMRHALGLKFGNNQEEIRNILEDTDGKPIVEISSRDDFWGTIQKGDLLYGQNILGRLLMELRGNVLSHSRDKTILIQPPKVDNYTLLGKPVRQQAFKPPIIREPTFTFDA